MLHLHSTHHLDDKPAIDAGHRRPMMENAMTADFVNKFSAALASTIITVAVLSPFAVLSMLV